MDAATVLANAEALYPAIAARSDEIEALRRLPEDLVATLRARVAMGPEALRAASPPGAVSFRPRKAGIARALEAR